MKKNATKRSLVLSILSLVLCVAMLLGTTFAWFTDSVTSGRNTIVAGNLDVALYHSNAKVTTPENVQDFTDLFDVDFWEPGVICYENFTVKNEGTLALKYALNLNVFDKNATTEEHDLTEVIKVAVVENGFSGDRASAQAITTYESLKDFQKTGNLTAEGTSHDSDTYGVVLYWQPTDHDNDYNVNNGKSVKTSDLGVTAENAGNALFVEFGVNLVATQDTVEADSFDEQYDATAPLAVMSTPMTKPLAETESLKIVVPQEAQSSVKEASVPAAVANAVFNEVFKDSTATDKSLTLVLNVEEKSKTETTFNYEIDMDAVIKEITGTEVTKSETMNIKELDISFTDFVEVQMNIETGFDNVKVKHNGNDMTEVANKETIPAEDQNAAGYFNYTKASGLTKLWIKSFSPFVITGEKDPYLAMLAQIEAGTAPSATEYTNNAIAYYWDKDATTTDNSTYIFDVNHLTGKTGMMKTQSASDWVILLKDVDFGNFQNATSEKSNFSVLKTNFDFNGYTVSLAKDTNELCIPLVVNYDNIEIKSSKPGAIIKEGTTEKLVLEIGGKTTSTKLTGISVPSIIEVDKKCTIRDIKIESGKEIAIAGTAAAKDVILENCTINSAGFTPLKTNVFTMSNTNFTYNSLICMLGSSTSSTTNLTLDNCNITMENTTSATAVITYLDRQTISTRGFGSLVIKGGTKITTCNNIPVFDIYETEDANAQNVPDNQRGTHCLVLEACSFNQSLDSAMGETLNSTSTVDKTSPVGYRSYSPKRTFALKDCVASGYQLSGSANADGYWTVAAK